MNSSSPKQTIREIRDAAADKKVLRIIGFQWITKRCQSSVGRLALLLHLLKKSCTDMWFDGCFTQSAAISYYFVVSIFPILLLLIAIAGFFLEPEEAHRKVLNWLGQYFPAGTRIVFRENIESIIEARNTFGFLGVASLLWSSTLMFDAINEAVNAAWGTRGETRFLMDKLKSLLLIGVIVIGATISTFFTAQFALVSRFESLLKELPWMRWAVHLSREALTTAGTLLPFFLGVCAFALAYRLLPRKRVTIRDVWPAAIAAAFFWEISKLGFVWYLTEYANYAQIYGSISAVLILMLWAYVSSMILMWGAELTAETWKARSNKGPIDQTS